MKPASDTNSTAGNRVTASTAICAGNNCDKNTQHTGKNGNVRINQVKNDTVDAEHIAQAMIPKAIDRIFRTAQRIAHETQIVTELERFVAEHKLNMKVMPFGSSTYGFGGIDTDFNVCLLLNDGNG